MKFIDLLSDKIDFLFRRSKNADERTYDFFIRTVTFLILALIILCYGSFVHADGLTLYQYFNIDGSKLTNSSWYLFNEDDNEKFMNELNNTTNVEYLSLTGSGVYSSNAPINNVLAISGFDLSNNYIFVYDSTSTWIEFWLVPKSLIDSGQVVAYVPYGSSSVAFYSSSGFSADVWSVTYTNVNNAQEYDNSYYGIYSVPSGNFDPDSLQGAWNYRIAFTNAPLLRSDNMSNQVISDWVNSGFIDDYPSMYNCNYYTFTPDLSDIYNGGSTVESESARNHLYLEDFQIGLSATTNLADLMSSDVIIGISGDDYIQNHPDEFEIWIDYHVMLKDSITGISDPDVHYSYYYPARTFLNGVYSMGINEIFEHMTLSNNSSLYSYYRNLKDTYNQKVVADGQTFVRGLFPDLYKTLWEHYIGGYYVDNAVTTNNTIFNFDFEVSVAIRESGSNNISGIGTKKFDFLNGTESITTASVLQNHDPWEGESNPQMSPAVPSTGSSISSGSGGSGNVNVKVDVSGQKIPLGVKTKAQMEEILKNYRDVYGEFDSNWYTLADENDDNNFLKILGLTLPEIPAMDYMVKCACVIFGLAVVLFVLKVLLF